MCVCICTTTISTKLALQGFDYHVENEHSMWDYIKYIMYLEGIDISDHNAIEHYVHCQVLKCYVHTVHLW